jgi:hypothetical protein
VMRELRLSRVSSGSGAFGVPCAVSKPSDALASWPARSPVAVEESPDFFYEESSKCLVAIAGL